MVEDGSTIASTNIYSTTGTYDKKTYINIGSGNVFKLSWIMSGLTGDAVDRYSLIIKRHDTTINTYYDIFDKNIGLVNEFYVNSELLPALPEQYMLSIYLVAYTKNGNVITSNIVNPYISKGSGTYVKTEDTTGQTMWKRALAFTKAATTADAIGIIKDSSGNIVSIKDGTGNAVQIQATRILTSSDWNVVQESYIKDGSIWKASDIKWEVLTDNTGEIVTDNSGKQIYTL